MKNFFSKQTTKPPNPNLFFAPPGREEEELYKEAFATQKSPHL